MASTLNAPQYNSPAAAREYLERLRWPKGPICPHCGSVSKDHYELKGEAHRAGLWKCKDCRTQFTVTVGTVFERSKIALNVWLQAVHLLCSSKKGMSSNQLHRILGVTLKTAWFMSHRIREAMAPGGGGLLGGGGGIVEVDETFYGIKDSSRKPGRLKKGTRRDKIGIGDKRPIIALVERGGETRAYHIPNIGHETLKTVLNQISRDAHLMTDEATRFWNIGKEFAQHSRVNHSEGEYARGNITTNTVEGFFSILKRGLNGTYQYVSEAHLQRYVNEFSFRYNNREAAGVNDQERADNALRQIAGKRLTYRPTNAQA